MQVERSMSVPQKVAVKVELPTVRAMLHHYPGTIEVPMIVECDNPLVN